MPKLTQNNSNYINIPLSQIIETGNVRKDYNRQKIEQLAQSIKKNGLLNPLTVKRTDKTDEYGNIQYELFCDHRRKRALEFLCSQGNDFNNVSVFIKQGSKNRMQLIENIQREDLLPEEIEAALRQMISEGMSQTEIAEETSKPLSWVSDFLAGAKVRDTAQAAGINTSGIGTKALSQLRSIPTPKIPNAVETLIKNGGTVKKATEIKDTHKEINKPENEILKKHKTTTISIEKVIEIILDYKQKKSKSTANDKTFLANLGIITTDIIMQFSNMQE